ncbi:MAG: RecX family transcriptional regulator, partial [Blautia massiliensis (ex Durand et al. 2017)]
MPQIRCRKRGLGRGPRRGTGLLNDASFARRRAAELLRKHKSRREILQDLAAKGIDRDTAAAAVEDLYAPDGEGEDPE